MHSKKFLQIEFQIHETGLLIEDLRIKSRIDAINKGSENQ